MSNIILKSATNSYLTLCRADFHPCPFLTSSGATGIIKLLNVFGKINGNIVFFSEKQKQKTFCNYVKFSIYSFP